MPQTILFLCVANSARSQMAEGLARAMLPEPFEICSAGSEPATLNPLAAQVMAEVGIVIDGQFSKGFSAVPLEQIDTVITLCEEEVCPALHPGTVHHHWPVTDPAATAGDESARLQAFRDVRDKISAMLRSEFGDGGRESAIA